MRRLREMNFGDIGRPKNNLERVRVIQTRSSRKVKPDDEIIMLMRTARNKFRKSIDSGKITILNEREWMLR